MQEEAAVHVDNTNVKSFGIDPRLSLLFIWGPSVLFLLYISTGTTHFFCFSFKLTFSSVLIHLNQCNAEKKNKCIFIISKGFCSIHRHVYNCSSVDRHVEFSRLDTDLIGLLSLSEKKSLHATNKKVVGK